MPHVTFVPLTGFRVREPEMLKLGMSLPGLRDRASAIAELPALGALTLAGATPEPWTCNYHGICEISDNALDRILEEKPDLVAVSALTASIESAYQLCRRLKEHRIPTVLGGLHATARPDEVARHADAVVTGRGELIWDRVLTDVLSGDLKPKYHAAHERLPEWPMPRFDLLGQSPPRFTLQTQTGCPFSCGFCAASRLLGRFSEKPADAVREELSAIRQIAPRPMIELADDNTFAGERDVDEFFDTLEEANVRWFTEADWRIGERPEVLRRLKSSGCVQILVGIESLVFRYPGMGEKRAELEQIMDSVRAIQDAGVAVNGCFIVGADGETDRSLDSLTGFLLESPLAEIQVTLQTPFPGTSLYRRLAQENRLLTDRGWSAYSLFDVTFQPDMMSVQELEAGFRRVLSEVFSADAHTRRRQLRRQIMRHPEVTADHE